MDLFIRGIIRENPLNWNKEHIEIREILACPAVATPSWTHSRKGWKMLQAYIEKEKKTEKRKKKNNHRALHDLYTVFSSK